MLTDSLAGRTVIVTGAATGIGRAIAAGFAQVDANVVVADLDEARAARTALELASGHDAAKLASVRCDVTDAGEVAHLFSYAETRFGAVGVLVNNAGLATHGRFEDIPEADWGRVLAVNAEGVFLSCQQFARRCRQAGRAGAIVNIASQAGKRGYHYVVPYCASKGAVIALTRALALEVAPLLRVNAVCPGIVVTEMMEREYAWLSATTGQSRADVIAAQVAAIPSGRRQEPHDVVPGCCSWPPMRAARPRVRHSTSAAEW